MIREYVLRVRCFKWRGDPDLRRQKAGCMKVRSSGRSVCETARSNDLEERDGVQLPSYRGDIINGFDFDPVARTPDPARMERAFVQASSTLNLLPRFFPGAVMRICATFTPGIWISCAAVPRNQVSTTKSQKDWMKPLPFMEACGNF